MEMLAVFNGRTHGSAPTIIHYSLFITTVCPLRRLGAAPFSGENGNPFVTS